MSSHTGGKVTYVPSPGHRFEEHDGKRKKKSASALESIYWQSIGWVHTPSFIQSPSDSGSKLKTPKSTVELERSRFHTKKSVEPKLHIENKVPYGVLPKDVAVDIEKRRFASQDLKTILIGMGIETAMLLPSVVVYKNGIVTLKSEASEGIPSQPFLDLDLFDDAVYYDLYSADKWLSLGDTEGGREPLPALAFVPVQECHVAECLNFDWCKVIVLDYDAEKKLYSVRRDSKCQDNEDESLDDESQDMWIPRIYLKFDAEEPLRFAKRLQTALHTRHVVEESLRMNYYVECMPLEHTPEWSETDLDAIIATARRSRSLQPRLQWIKDHLTTSVSEMKLEYKRAYNYMCYAEIAQQDPCPIRLYKNESLGVGENRYSMLEVVYDDPYEVLSENFGRQTLITCVEVARTLIGVQSNILALRGLSLYNLSTNATYTLENFDTLQRTQLEKISNYVRGAWMSDISNAILLNLESCGKGQYDLNQRVLRTFELTKLGKLLKMTDLKMKDTIRFLVVESLEKYAAEISTACSKVVDLKDNFKWTGDLCSKELSPPGNPVFEVPLEIKGDRLHFVVELQKYGKTVRDLFDEGLRVTKDLPRIKKFVMKKILYDPLEKLESVGENEKQVVRWKMDIERGMNRAMVAVTAYIRAYDEPLKSFKTDQINYVKQLARSKASCDQMKQIIEMHNTEKKKLEDTIPSFMDIGPFRLMTRSVRQAAIKKHELLAGAVLNHFYTKLRQFMEHINNQFLVLLDRIGQPTGNIEDLLDKKQWCRTVPKKIERLSEDVNRLRTDVKLISTFHKNMEDGDSHTFWQVQKLPQESMRKLHHRISLFEGEKNQHKEHLHSDQETLKENLEKLRQIIAKFVGHSELSNAAPIATEVRQTRKSLVKYDEQSQLYKKRERLFGLPMTDYQEISEMSESLVPYENFWLSAAEFKKYKERDDSDLLSIEPSQLRETINEFRSNLSESLGFFTEELHPTIRRSVLCVLQDVEEFIATRLPPI